MTAREKFQKGDRVRLTDAARSHGLKFSVGRRERKPVETGTVVGFGRGGRTVIVIVTLDGQNSKNRSSYSMEFWEKIENPVG